MEFPTTIFARPLGSTLNPRDKESFENIRREIDRCTDEILLQPDWGANLSCCDAINSASSQAVVDEAFVAIRRKFSSRAPNVTLVALHLAESIVKNCGDRAHRAANDEAFMKDLAKVARKYTAKKGDSNAREVSELSLDIIQAWGEAFLPRSKVYPNFAKTYHELRKEGLPFRPQYDESRVPVFTPPPSIPDDLHFPQDAYFDSPNTMMDAELAAALALSMAESQPAPQQRHHHSHHHSSSHRSGQSGVREEVSSTRTPFHPSSGSTSRVSRPVENNGSAVSTTSSTTEVVSGCQSSMMILKEMILAAKNNLEIRSNEIVEEVVAQLRIQQGALGTAIERELGASTGQDIETMFKINDDAGLMIQLYSGLKSGETQLTEAKLLLESLFPGENSAQQPKEPAKPPASANDDLLDIFLSTPATPQQSAPVQSSTPPAATAASKPIAALAPPPPTPSRVLPPSLQKPQQVGQSVDIFGDPVRTTSQSNPPPMTTAQPALDIFGDPIKPASSQIEVDPFSSKVSIDDIMSHSIPSSAPPQQYPQYPQYPSPPPPVAAPAAPSLPYDPFAYAPPPNPLQASYASYPPQPVAFPPQVTNYYQPPVQPDPFAPPSQYPPQYPPSQPIPQPSSSQPPQSYNPFDMF